MLEVMEKVMESTGKLYSELEYWGQLGQDPFDRQVPLRNERAAGTPSEAAQLGSVQDCSRQGRGAVEDTMMLLYFHAGDKVHECPVPSRMHSNWGWPCHKGTWSCTKEGDVDSSLLKKKKMVPSTMCDRSVTP